MKLILTSMFAIVASAQVPSPARELPVNYGRLPLSFEANQGQTDARVKFVAHGAGYSIYLSPGSATFSLERPDQAAVVRMDLVGANQAAGIEPQDKLPGIANYMIGAKRTTNIPTYAKIRSRGVYPGIDLVYYGTQGQLEYDFVLAPGADPSRIRMTFAGATPAVNASGDLVLPLGDRDIRFRKPVLYQDIDGVRKPVSGRFTVAANSHEAAFKISSYDRGRELVIDPVLAYSSYLGGPQYPSQISAMTLNAAGDIYITGNTLAIGFPTTVGVIEPTCPAFPTIEPGNPLLTYNYGCKFGFGENLANSAFVSKVSANGQTLLYSTFLGGAGTWTGGTNWAANNDYGTGIAVDSGDNAWVVGTTGSNDFPITPSTAFQPNCDPQAPGTLYTPVFGSYCGASNYAVFLVQLNPTGTTELYGTFVNGTGWSIGGAQIVLDRSGNIYVAGTVYNTPSNCCATFVPFPTTASAYQTVAPATNFGAFVTEFAPGGRTLIYSTMFGGLDQGAFTVTDGLAVSGGKIYIGGQTNDPQLPTTLGALSRTCVRAQPGDQTCSGNASQAFVAEFDPAKSGAASLVFSTYLNGSTLAHGDESSQAFALAADTAGNVYAGGFTTYSAADGFPATLGALQPTCALKAYSKCSTNFVTKLSQTGSLVWSTFYGSPSGAGGGNNNGVTAIAVDSSDNVYITGGADGQGDIPLNSGLQSYSSGVAFVTELNSSGSQVLFGTFYGGGADIYPNTLALDSSNNIYFAGYTNNNLPLANALQGTNAGGSPQGFFAKIATTTPQTITFGPLSNMTYGAAPFNVSASASSGLTVSFAPTTPSTCTVSGTLVTIVQGGACTIQATQLGNQTYSPAQPVNQTFQILPASPRLFWAAPQDILFGGALGSAQLNATAITTGTFVYTPPAGTVLSPGLGQTLSATFTPSNPANYNGGTVTTQINVVQGGSTPANLVVTAVLSADTLNGPPYVWVTYTVANTGGSPALAVRFTALTLGGIGAPYAPFPIQVGTGTIPAGGQATVSQIVFSEAGLGASGSRTVIGVTGTYNGATTGISFGASIRATLP